MTAMPPPPPYPPVPPPLPAPAPLPAALREVVPQGVRWGLPAAAITLALLPLSILAAFAYAGSGLPVDPELASFLFSLLGYAALLVALVVITLRRGQRSFRADFGFAFRPIDLAIGLGVFVVAKIAAGVAGLLVYAVSGETPKSGNFILGTNPLWIVLTGVLIGSLIAPVVEELVLRGLVLRAIRFRVLRGRRSAPHPQPAPRDVQVRAIWVSVLISSALFAIGHLWEAPGDGALFAVLGLTTLIIGILHALITVATGRLGAAMVSHVLFNGSGVLLQVLFAGSLPGS